MAVLVQHARHTRVNILSTRQLISQQFPYGQLILPQPSIRPGMPTGRIVEENGRETTSGTTRKSDKKC
jgi:hypothetical protein